MLPDTPRQLSPAEYDAIAGDLASHAMGVAFLAAYAEHVRDADTLRLLDAVDRLEAEPRCPPGAAQVSALLRDSLADARRDLTGIAARGSARLGVAGRFPMRHLARIAAGEEAASPFAVAVIERFAVLFDTVAQAVDTANRASEEDTLIAAVRQTLSIYADDAPQPPQATIPASVIAELADALGDQAPRRAAPHLRLAASRLATNCSADARQPNRSA